MDAPTTETPSPTQLLPVLPLRDTCLFPGASLAVALDEPLALAAVQMAARTGGPLLAVARREGGEGPHDLLSIGTVALVHAPDDRSAAEPRVELDGLTRARVERVIGLDVLVAEVEVLPEGEPGDSWDEAVEALARYLHAHPDLRAFLEARRRSASPLAWVSLACQHLPVSAAVRQSLLEASAADRCARIGRSLEALLRKEQQQP
ncbi:MAG: LON peptidase substrate-binding domain-containing protein [Vicinamibacteria bacterium]